MQTPARSELTPFQAAAHAALETMGIPRTDDLNDLDESQGVVAEPGQHRRRRALNTAFAYLDPVRGKPNLTIVGNAHGRPADGASAAGSPAPR